MKQKKVRIKLSWLIKGSEERAIPARFLKTMLWDALADKAGLCCLWMPSPFLVRIIAHWKMLKQLITGGGPQKAEESGNMDFDSKLHLENYSRKPSRNRFFHCPIKQALWPNTSSLAPILHLLRGWGYFHQVSDEPGHCEKQQPLIEVQKNSSSWSPREI